MKTEKALEILKSINQYKEEGEIKQAIDTVSETIEKDKEKIDFLREWDYKYGEILGERNGKARKVLSKIKKVKTIDLLHMGEQEVWDELLEILKEITNEQSR